MAEGKEPWPHTLGSCLGPLCEPEFQLNHWTSIFPVALWVLATGRVLPISLLHFVTLRGHSFSSIPYLSSMSTSSMVWLLLPATLQRLLLPLLHSVAVNKHRSALHASSHHASSHFYSLLMMFLFHTAPAHSSSPLGFISSVGCSTSFFLQFFRVT